MRIIIVFLICINSLALHSQPIDIYGGTNRNLYFGVNNSGHFNASYQTGNGFSAGIGIDSIKVDWLMMRFSLQFDRYNGNFTASDGGLGGGYSTTAMIEKSVISLGAFPLNFNIKKRLDLNFGFEISRLIGESFSGTYYSWMMESTPSGMHAVGKSEDLNTRYDSFNSRGNIGLKGRIAYDIVLTKRLCLVPQYSYYFGLSKEFTRFPEVTKSMRHYFCLGIKRK